MTVLMNPAEIASALAYVRCAPENRQPVGKVLRALGESEEAFALWLGWTGRNGSAQDRQSEWDSLDPKATGEFQLPDLLEHARACGWDGGYESYGNRGRLEPRLVALERRRKLSAFNRFHGLVLLNGETGVVYRSHRPKGAGIATSVASVDSMRVYYANQFVPQLKHYPEGYTLSDKTPLVDEWLRWDDRRVYHRVIGGGVDHEADSLDLPDGDEIVLTASDLHPLRPPTQAAQAQKQAPPLQLLETIHMLQPNRTEIAYPPSHGPREEFE